MTAGSTRPAIIAVLDEIAQWKVRADDEHAVSLRDIAREEGEARRAIEEAQRQLTALETLRREIEERHAAVARETEGKERAALRDGLRADRDALEERALHMALAEQTRVEEVQRRLAEPDVAEAISEFEKFDEVAGTLDALPASYRRAMVAHHEQMKRQLEPIITAINAPPAAIEADDKGICVLFAIDPPEGAPEALVVVLPVPYAVFAEWSDRTEDLSAALAYRLIAAVSRVLRSVDAGDAPIQYIELHGCLAVQVWLGDVEVRGELRERALEEIEAVREEAAELRAAAVELYGLWVRPSLLTDEEDA